MVAAGAAFMYFVMGLVDGAESTTPGIKNSPSRQAKEYARYYEKDVNGDDVLNLLGVPLSKAKKIWTASTVRARAMGYFPDFDTMKLIIDGQLVASEFKTFLLAELKRIEGDYLDGIATLDRTRKAFEEIK